MAPGRNVLIEAAVIATISFASFNNDLTFCRQTKASSVEQSIASAGNLSATIDERGYALRQRFAKKLCSLKSGVPSAMDPL